MKFRAKTILFFIAMLFLCGQLTAIAQNQFEDISNGASVFVFQKTPNLPRDAASQSAARDGIGQRIKGYERRRVIKVKKSAPAAPAISQNRNRTKPVPAAVAEPIAPEDWINEEADLAIEERKIADDEPLLFLSKGYLNSKIQFCESPLFPDDARRAKLKQVRQKISVTIGKYGGVLDAQVIEGDPVFRDAVYKSLQSMRFRETYFMGQPVRIQGILDLTQTPANDILCRVAGKEAEIPTVIEGGDLNEYAKTCEVPNFPAEAKTAGLKSVTAQVQVIVDEKGAVVYAAPVGGHPAFGLAAAKATEKATFPVSSIIRQPVKIRGILVFTQTPNNDGSCKTVAAE
jgi:outer membrane biosynthesis protein TonB